MSLSEKNSDTYLSWAFQWAKSTASITEDLSWALLSFIPNGLDQIYDTILKPFPLLGTFFSYRAVEQVFKWGLGITFGQGIAADVAHYLFKPIGYGLGLCLGLLGFAYFQPTAYKAQVSEICYQLSGQTVGGGLIGVGVILVVAQFLPELFVTQLGWMDLALACWVGAMVGLVAKSMFLLAVNAVNTTNAMTVRRNSRRAKELNVKLKNIAKQRAKSRILKQAQDTIQRMNGPQSQLYLEDFFSEKFEKIAINTYKKMDRHFNYLTDRACHGDLSALKRLRELAISQKPGKETEKTALDKMLDRIFNTRAIVQIKDDVDTQYDRWFYRHLVSTESDR